MWFIDCFCYAALGGTEFPVNSYSSESLDIVLDTARSILKSEIAGIDEIRISRETKGQSPQPIKATLTNQEKLDFHLTLSNECKDNAVNGYKRGFLQAALSFGVIDHDKWLELIKKHCLNCGK